MRFLATLSVTILLAQAASAQVAVHGRVEVLPAPVACAPGATHRVADTDVYLFSQTVNLNQAVTPRRIIGTLVPAGCPLIDVSALENIPFSLIVCNHPGLGCNVTLDLCPAPKPAVTFLFVAAATDFVPVSLESASFLLAAPFLPVATLNQTVVCQSQPIQIAGPSSIIGLTVYFQGAALPTGWPAVPGVLSNVVGMTIDPPGGCTSFACF